MSERMGTIKVGQRVYLKRRARPDSTGREVYVVKMGRTWAYYASTPTGAAHRSQRFDIETGCVDAGQYTSDSEVHTDTSIEYDAKVAQARDVIASRNLRLSGNYNTSAPDHILIEFAAWLTDHPNIVA